MQALTLRDGVAEAVVVPELGAGLAAYDLVRDGVRAALFRPCREPAAARPFHLALNLLVPWSGRISGGGFAFGGAFHPLSPMIVGEKLPLHGNGLLSAWSVDEVAATRAALSLRSDGPGPYRYNACVVYVLEDGALSVALDIAHHGPEPLPYGAGLHPWFLRTPATTLQAPASVVMLEDERHLPAGERPIHDRPDWNFATARPLPDGWINNDFSGWNGRAAIDWPEFGLGLRIDASAPLSRYIVYSPGRDAGFFCFEPITHGVDAHNDPAGPERRGLVVLATNDLLSLRCRFTPAAS